MMFPLATFDLIDLATANRCMVEWGHNLGACNRPFGAQAFGLYVEGIGFVSVAMSASTVGPSAGPYKRRECVELSRQCSHPDHRWATRPCVRLWREIAPKCWANEYWPVKACVFYALSRHAGDIYRFDGWKCLGMRRGTKGGGTWTKARAEGSIEAEDKALWVYELPVVGGMIDAREGWK